MKQALLCIMPLVVSAKCYADKSDASAIDGCKCHSSCTDCGYDGNPTMEM